MVAARASRRPGLRVAVVALWCLASLPAHADDRAPAGDGTRAALRPPVLAAQLARLVERVSLSLDVPGEGGRREPGGDQILLAFVGDLLLHMPLQNQAMINPRGFRSLWMEVEPILRSADISYANLEGVIAPGVTLSGVVVDESEHPREWIYTGYPRFNYPSALADALRDAAFDVVSTANNHSLDRDGLGADLTIEALRRAAIAFTGTRHRADPSMPWYTVVEAKGMRLAWLACTYGTNGIPDRDDQVLLCFEDRSTVLHLVETLAARPDIDAVVVTPHWGREYETTVSDAQRALAVDLIEAGALLVVGSHPHVVQRWEQHLMADGRVGAVLYSLGNFVSNQRSIPRESSVILLASLGRAPTGGLEIRGMGYVPIHMAVEGPPGSEDRYRLRVAAAAEPSLGNRRHLERILGARMAVVPPAVPLPTPVALAAADGGRAVPGPTPAVVVPRVRPWDEAATIRPSEDGTAVDGAGVPATLADAAEAPSPGPVLAQASPARDEAPVPVGPDLGEAGADEVATVGAATEVPTLPPRLSALLSIVDDTEVRMKLVGGKSDLAAELARLRIENAQLKELLVEALLRNQSLKAIVVEYLPEIDLSDVSPGPVR